VGSFNEKCLSSSGFQTEERNFLVPGIFVRSSPQVPIARFCEQCGQNLTREAQANYLPADFVLSVTG
jgi:hypothetical protein